MKCKNCGCEMYLAFTSEWVCKTCGRKYATNGRFISKDVIKRV